MIKMTAHIEAKKEEIAKNVIMPGDPLRAKEIATKYLENAKCINNVRGMLGFTGTYKNKPVTVFASGMGMPSMGIYAYELFKFYDVETIIRVGSTGAYTPDLKLYDVILADEAYSNSSFAKVQSNNTNQILKPTESLNNKIKNTAEKLNMKLHTGRIHSSDVFYKENNEYQKMVKEHNCICVEMESFALFQTADLLKKQAACLLTVSDSFVTKEETTSEERQKSFTQMIELALESIIENE